MAVIQTMGLSKRYKDNWAVDHLDLRVEQGDIYGFIWPERRGQIHHIEAPVRPGPAHTGRGIDLRQAHPGFGGPPAGGGSH